jgi:hypothetical protein
MLDIVRARCGEEQLDTPRRPRAILNVLTGCDPTALWLPTAPSPSCSALLFSCCRLGETPLSRVFQPLSPATPAHAFFSDESKSRDIARRIWLEVRAWRPLTTLCWVLWIVLCRRRARLRIRGLELLCPYWSLLLEGCGYVAGHSPECCHRCSMRAIHRVSAN